MFDKSVLFTVLSEALPSSRFAPQRDSTIDTQRGEDELLQVWPLVLAIAIGDPKGHL